MKKELKIKISDYKDIEKMLLGKGAVFIKEALSKYTYLNQPTGKVLKITENDNGVFKTIIEKDGDKFNILANEPLSKLAERKRLEEDFGIKKELSNRRRFFKINNLTVSTNQIENVGQFLIITGEDPSISFVETVLELKNPQIVTDSFDNIE